MLECGIKLFEMARAITELQYECALSGYRQSHIRKGPSGPAFRTRAGGALGTTGHNRSQYHNQVHQECQQNENQV